MKWGQLTVHRLGQIFRKISIFQCTTFWLVLLCCIDVTNIRHRNSIPKPQFPVYSMAKRSFEILKIHYLHRLGNIFQKSYFFEVAPLTWCIANTDLQYQDSWLKRHMSVHSLAKGLFEMRTVDFTPFGTILSKNFYFSVY